MAPTKRLRVVDVSTEEQTERDKKRQAREDNRVKGERCYPMRTLRAAVAETSVEADVLGAIAVDKDTAYFFVDPRCTRAIVPPNDLLGNIDSEKTFKPIAIKPSAFVEVAEKLPEEVKTVLGKYLPQQSLELEGTVPKVELVDGSKTKLPNIILTDNEWTEPEAIARYIPYVFENSPKLGVINQDAYHAIMSLVFAIPYDMNDLPACGSEDAKALWQEKFAGRLGFASVGDVYTIVYSLRIKNLALAWGMCKGIDQRVMKQADVRLVRYWIRMTERLVGKEEVQDKVREYVDNEIYKVDFIRNSLVEEAKKACEEWPMWPDGEAPTPEALKTASAPWKMMDYRNPSVLMVTKTADDGQILESENELLFVSTTSDKAKFALMLNQAGVHDSLDGYTATGFGNNLKDFGQIFRALADAVAGTTLTKVKKNFSTAVSVHDDSRRRGAKAKRVDAASSEIQDLKQLVSNLPKLIVDALMEAGVVANASTD